MNRPVRLACAATALLAAAAASASGPVPRGEPFAVRVPVAGLDLGTEQGREALRDRMRSTAKATCAPGHGAYEPRSLQACRRAFETAAATALARADLARGTR